MKKIKTYKPFPDFIVGDGFYLRIHKVEDADELVNMVNRNKDFDEYLDLNHYHNIQSAKKVIAQRIDFAKRGWLGDYAIQLFSGKLIGCISFINRGDKSVGGTYYLDKQYRNMGYITKALKVAEKEIAKLDFTRIVLEINKHNENSIRVATKNNYRLQDSEYEMKDFVKDISNTGR